MRISVFRAGIHAAVFALSVYTGCGFAQTAPEVDSSSRFRDPVDNQFDIGSFLEKPRHFLPVPVVITEPAVGFGGGIFGLFLQPRRDAGKEGWARPNMSTLGLAATENGTQLGLAADSRRWLDGRLRTLAGLGAGKINLDFYGAAVDLPTPAQKLGYSLEFTGAVMQVNWQLAADSPWIVGMRYVYADVDPTLRDQPSSPQATDRARVRVSAPTAVLEFDTRDNIFTPTRGIYTETSYLVSRETLGSSDDFERFGQIVLAWRRLPHAVTLGARLDYAWSSEGTPFFMLPYIPMRGVAAMRYQGDQMAALELEARWQFKGRWSLVAFGGAGGTQTDRSSVSNSQGVGSGGVGFRYELARKFGLHAGVDVAASPGEQALYLQVGSAWFRP